MKVQSNWIQGLKFTAKAGAHSVNMDAKLPVGTETAMNPKELVLAGLLGCTGMDVASLLRKHKQKVESLEIVADAKMTEGAYPAVFKEVHLLFTAHGEIDAEKMKEAVTLSQTKYCGVSKMISKAAPIFYRVVLNGAEIHSGQTHFE